MAETPKKIQDAIIFIESCRKELEIGNVVVLEDFQNHVKDICDDMAQLTVEEMTSQAPMLEKLAESLQVLEVELRQQKVDVEHEIKDLNKKQAATKAYGKAGLTGNSDSDDDNL